MASDIFNNGDFFCGVRKKPPQNLLLNWRHSSNITKTLEKNCHLISNQGQFRNWRGFIQSDCALLFYLTAVKWTRFTSQFQLFRLLVSGLFRSTTALTEWIVFNPVQPPCPTSSVQMQILSALHLPLSALHLSLALPSPPPSFSTEPQGNVPMQNHVRHSSRVQEISKSPQVQEILKHFFCNKSLQVQEMLKSFFCNKSPQVHPSSLSVFCCHCHVRCKRH